MIHSALADGIRNLRRKLASQQDREDSDEHLLLAFSTHRDETAFTILVRRHGPMVLQVCRRVLGNEQDAEDAFQATFLVLAREAAVLRKKAALPSFLYGTAYRLALSAKRAAGRRRKYEGSLGALRQPRSPAGPADELLWREVRALLDAEIACLPEKYRSVFVLCCLEELSRAEAGQRLGLKERTVLSRLAAARKRLQRRLARRGVELTAVLATAGLATQPASALPAMLVETTIKAAMATAAGEGLARVASASVVELMQAGGAMLPASKAKAAVLLLALILLSGAGLWFHAQPQAALAPPDPPKTPNPPKADANLLVLRGRVVGPENKPVAGAKLYLPRRSKEREQDGEHNAAVQRGVADKDGRFRLELPRSEIPTGRDVSLVAASDGFGLAWIELSNKDVSGELTMRLVKDVPIRGRLLTTEGKPVAGATVTVVGVMAFERLDDFLRVFQKESKHIDEGTGARRLDFPLNDVLHVHPTDKDGRFEMKGIGVERLVGLRVKNAALADSPMLVVTRASFDAKSYAKDLLRGRGERVPPLFGPSFEHVVERAEAKRAIEGTVREAGSGKAVAGATVQALGVLTRTDAQGRYRLVGMRKAEEYFVQVSAPENALLIGRYQRVKAPDGASGKPARVDIELLRGVIVTGRVYDKATGKGVRDCSVHFSPLPENKTPQIEGLTLYSSADKDGRFRLVSIPGPGVLLAGVPGNLLKIDGVPIDIYKRAEFDAADRRRVQMVERKGPYREFRVASGIETLDISNACKVLDVKDDGKPVTCDLALDPGKTRTVQLQDPEGEPLIGAVVAGIGSFTKRVVPLRSAACTIYALDPENPRAVAFLHAQRKLAALATLRGDEKQPVTVKLAPTAVLTGRVLDSAGQPVAGAEIYWFYATPLGKAETSYSAIPAFALRDRMPRTDNEGRFRLERIVPGLKVVNLRLLKGRQTFESQPRLLDIKPLQSGQTLDVGDIRTKPQRP
jgi:RNA polymerase sigma factor (sigma-70 family)